PLARARARRARPIVPSAGSATVTQDAISPRRVRMRIPPDSIPEGHRLHAFVRIEHARSARSEADGTIFAALGCRAPEPGDGRDVGLDEYLGSQRRQRIGGAQ